MSGDNFWEEDGEEEFRDIPEETQAKTAQELAMMHMQSGALPPPRMAAPAPAPVRDDGIDPQQIVNSEDDEEVDDSTTLSDARLRLAQGELYAIIMKHDLFQGMDTDPRAIKNVQKEIRKFAKERMEVMLGMRQEKLAQQYAEYNAELGAACPFNPMEIEILKRLASKATNGATETAEASTFAAPKRTSLNPILGSKPASPAIAKLPSAPSAPLKRPEAKQEDPKVLTGKQLHEMNESEKAQFLERKQKEIAERQARMKAAKPTNLMPAPSYEQEEAMYAQRFNSNGKAAGTVSTILALIEKQKGNK